MPSPWNMLRHATRWPRPVTSVRQATSELLFPDCCFACGESLDATALPGQGDALPLICHDCLQELPLLSGDLCRRCGAPAAEVQATTEEPLGCGRCRDVKLHFDLALAAGAYEGLLRHLILQAKHPAGDAIAMALGRLMGGRLAERFSTIKPDVVTAIPMHWHRRWVRQTNSSELMGEGIAQAARVPFAPKLLRRVRATRHQPQVARSERLPNVRNAFTLSPGYRLQGATVVLVDDILTTGSTCSEAAKALKQAGADRVVVIVAARSL